MNLTPDIIESIITGLIIGLGMVVYRVYQKQTADDQHDDKSHQVTSGNGFRVAMESVKESHIASVDLLHEQLDHMQNHITELEHEINNKDEVIDRLQKLLLAQGIITNDEGYVISYRAGDVKQEPSG